MRRDRVTRADRELLDALPSELGVTPRKLERWRQHGVIPDTIPQRGGERGSMSRYPSGSADQVAELARILADDNDLDRALLRLFIRRYPVRLESLKQLYFDLFAALARLEASRASPSDSRALRNGLARTVRFRLRKLATSNVTADELVRSVFAQVLEAFRGHGFGLDWDYDGDLTAELKRASGIDSAESDVIYEGQTLLPAVTTEELDQALKVASRRNLESVLRRASYPALEQARDQWRHVLTMLADLGTVASSAADRRRDIAGLDAACKLAGDELLIAVFVPVWLAAQTMMKRAGISPDSLWDPNSPKGCEYAELYHLLARLARTTKLPVDNERLPAAIAAAPEELRTEFVAWVERAPERSFLT
jgi:hypothetical protein